MSEDLISKNFTDQIDTGIIKRNIKLLQVILILGCVYSVFNLVDWYGTFASEPLQTNSSYFLHRIHPIIALVLTAVGIYTLLYSLKISKMILSSIENEDPSTYNNANKLYYRLAILSIFTHSLSIMSIITRFLLK